MTLQRTKRETLIRRTGVLFATISGMTLAEIGAVVTLWRVHSYAGPDPKLAALAFGFLGLINLLATLANLFRLRRELQADSLVSGTDV